MSMRSVLFFAFGFLAAFIVGQLVIHRALRSPPSPPPPAYKPAITDAELAARHEQVRQCLSRGGTPVMGFNVTAVCVKEFK